MYLDIERAKKWRISRESAAETVQYPAMKQYSQIKFKPNFKYPRFNSFLTQKVKPLVSSDLN